MNLKSAQNRVFDAGGNSPFDGRATNSKCERNRVFENRVFDPGGKTHDLQKFSAWLTLEKLHFVSATYHPTWDSFKNFRQTQADDRGTMQTATAQQASLTSTSAVHHSALEMSPT
jgi:hypothetical protein